MSNQDSRSPSPKRKPTPSAPVQPKIGGGFSSPKFSFRAALVQHKSKLVSKSKTPTGAGGETSVLVHSKTVSQDSKLARPIRTAASNIPSLRGRVNSTTATTTTGLERRTLENARSTSSLGKRGVDQVTSTIPSVSDFGTLLKPRTGTSASSVKIPSTTAGGGSRSKLPGPPSSRSQWTATGSTKMFASPSMSKAPRKVARSENVAEVHGISPNTSSSGVSPVETRIGGVGGRNRTISSSIVTQQRLKIGTLPKPKPKQVPIRTLLDERPQGLLLGGMGEAESDDGEEFDSEDSEVEDVDEEERLDVSRIRMKRVAASGEVVEKAASQTKVLPAGSRIPSIGSNTSGREATRAQRRSSINTIATHPVADSEKENFTHIPPNPANLGSKRHSLGPSLQSRSRTSLPFSTTQPSHLLAKESSRIGEEGATPPTKPASAKKQDLGIKSSIIYSNPIHPSIFALQQIRQPISTPEALMKAKKRLSGALLSSAGSSSSLVGVAGGGVLPFERGAGLGRSQSVSTRLSAVQKKAVATSRKQASTLQRGGEARGLVRSGSRSPIKSSLLLFPHSDSGSEEPSSAGAVRKPSPPPLPASAVSTSEIDANLLASLKVVAGKANLNVQDLLHTQNEGERGERERSEVSEDSEQGFGDVSLDLMALDLANSPGSDLSMLRSPTTELENFDTPLSVVHPRNTTVDSGKDRKETEDRGRQGDGEGEEEEVTDASLASPSVRASQARRGADVETPIRRGGGVKGGGGYRNVPSIPSTPFPNANSPAKCPPSAALSAKTRMRLKKALRESLGIEAHFATLNFNSASATVGQKGEDKGKEEENKLREKREEEGGGGGGGELRKSLSTMLLTDDDKYLDELVSAVARIGLEDLASEQHPPASHDDVVKQRNSVHPSAAEENSTAEFKSQLATALSELTTLRSALTASQTHTSALEAQLEQKISALERGTRMQTALESNLTALRGELAGVERNKAKEAWGRARIEALGELEEVKVQEDVMLVLKSQIGVWEGMVRNFC